MKWWQQMIMMLTTCTTTYLQACQPPSGVSARTSQQTQHEPQPMEYQCVLTTVTIQVKMYFIKCYSKYCFVMEFSIYCTVHTTSWIYSLSNRYLVGATYLVILEKAFNGRHIIIYNTALQWYYQNCGITSYLLGICKHNQPLNTTQNNYCTYCINHKI